jgi:hypothetical protein
MPAGWWVQAFRFPSLLPKRVATQSAPHGSHWMLLLCPLDFLELIFRESIAPRALPMPIYCAAQLADF